MATNTAGSPIPAGDNLQGVAVTPDGATVYGANATRTPSPRSRWPPTRPAPRSPPAPVRQAVAVTPDGATVYVAKVDSDTVTPIAVATNTAGTPIPVGDGPFAVAVTPDQAPVAALTVTPAAAGSPSTLDASASTVRFGSIAAYAWTFGDGTTAVTTTPVTSHTYTAAGNYTATVTATSTGGTSTTQVFTGQTMSRNGGPRAAATATALVPEPPPQHHHRHRHGQLGHAAPDRRRRDAGGRGTAPPRAGRGGRRRHPGRRSRR